jgi:hypothetical protein
MRHGVPPIIERVAIHQFSFLPMRCISGERSGNSVQRRPPCGDTTGKTDDKLQHLSTANHWLEQ